MIFQDRSNWPVGFGQLTPRGKMMQYHLGQYLRTRYAGFLPEIYDEHDIYVRASDVDRTMMSALSNLAGLYPPKGPQVWNPNLPWQPIPVHTVPLEQDNIIGSHFTCPKYAQLKNEINELPEIKKIYSENSWLFQYLSEKTGQNMTSLWDVGYLYDTFFIEQLYNKTLPAWTQNVYPDKMRFITDLTFKLNTFTHEMKRLRTGPLLQSVLDHFNGFIRKTHHRKLLMYSGHDTTVSAILNSLDLFDPLLPPPYASMIIIELKKNLENGQHFINMAYRNESNHQPYDLVLPKCQLDCPLKTFDDLTKHLRPEDWISECQISGGDLTEKTVTLFSLAVAFVLALILFLSVIIACVRNRCFMSSTQKNKDYKYFSIN